MSGPKDEITSPGVSPADLEGLIEQLLPQPPGPDGEDNEVSQPSSPAPTVDRFHLRRVRSEAPLERDDMPRGTPFQERGADRIGILGGKASGKSFLFQAMVFKSSNTSRSGALQPFLRDTAIDVLRANTLKDPAQYLNVERFMQEYQTWKMLESTFRTNESWYKLILPLRIGWLGLGSADLCFDFFDASGEAMEVEVLDAVQREVYASYHSSELLIFCVPAWVAFPRAERMTDEDWRRHALQVMGFNQVIHHVRESRRASAAPRPARTILALTMADDHRVALRTLQDKWIRPFIDQSERYNRELRSHSGVARYLDQARSVSRILAAEFDASPAPGIARIPSQLDLGGGPPWIIAVSAVDGEGLANAERSRGRGAQGIVVPPIPAHVELPLLLALCQRYNVLI